MAGQCQLEKRSKLKRVRESRATAADDDDDTLSEDNKPASGGVSPGDEGKTGSRRLTAATTFGTRPNLLGLTAACFSKRRADDGFCYTRREFVAWFGGAAEWDSAGWVKKRQAADGKFYTRLEFIEFFRGTVGEWDAAAGKEVPDGMLTWKELAERYEDEAKQKYKDPSSMATYLTAMENGFLCLFFKGKMV